jgi:hypothetical protein
MKKVAILLSSAVLFFAACGDNSNENPDKNSGDEQIQEPVLNSGPEAEASRATNAVRDSLMKDSAKKVMGDSGAHTLPH